MSVDVFCELSDQPFDSFCGTHSRSCCSLCHRVAYPDCKLEELSEATTKMEADIKEYEASLGELISKAKDFQVIVPDWLTKQDGREKAMVGVVKQLFSEIRRIVDDCEQNALSLVNETMSKHTLAARSMDKIVSVLSNLMKESQGLSLEPNVESCSNEGMAIQSGEEDVSVESQAASRISAAKMADSLNKRSHKLRQAINQSKTLLNDFENVYPIDYETVLNKKVLDSLENILKDSCSIGINHKPVGQLVKDVDFNVSGSQQVMTFLDKSAKSDIIIATNNPSTLMVVNQSGKTIKSVALTNNYEPYDVCQLNGRIYVTHNSQNQIAVYQASNLGFQTSFSVAGGCNGIDVVGDNLVAVCSSAKCVRMITTSGGVVAQSTHTFEYPWGLAVTPNDSTVVVADHTADLVVVLSADLATHLRTIPCVGSNPIGVCVYGTNIYICSYSSGQVMELSHGGQSSRSVLSVTQPAGICINAARRCFVVSGYQNGLIASYMAQP